MHHIGDRHILKGTHQSRRVGCSVMNRSNHIIAVWIQMAISSVVVIQKIRHCCKYEQYCCKYEQHCCEYEQHCCKWGMLGGEEDMGLDMAKLENGLWVTGQNKQQLWYENKTRHAAKQDTQKFVSFWYHHHSIILCHCFFTWWLIVNQNCYQSHLVKWLSATNFVGEGNGLIQIPLRATFGRSAIWISPFPWPTKFVRGYEDPGEYIPRY